LSTRINVSTKKKTIDGDGQVQPVVQRLSSGWTLIRFSKECFAQVPTGWKGEIPDCYIFHPDWNRDRINEWAGTEKEKENGYMGQT